ncbi:MAG: FHA domain-containing protein [Bacteroidales bacterium]|nr:FHA domain-containing protein [Bacteroidales bacterium]
MQCRFCGLENPEGTVICSRCGTVLGKSAIPENNAQNYAEGVGGQEPKSGNDRSSCEFCGYPLLPNTKVCPNCHKTVVEEEVEIKPIENVAGVDEKTDVDEKKNDPKKTVVAVGHAVDPKKTVVAGAPVAPVADSKKTVVAGAPVASAADPKKTVVANAPAASVTDPKKTVVANAPVYKPKDTIPEFRPKATVVENKAAQDVKDAKKTVNPYANIPHRQPMAEAYCSIEPVPDSPAEAGRLKKFEFDKQQVVLRRENTEPGNSSITSKEQAVLTFENGAWYVEDKSAFQTTFVRAGRKLQLQDGDMILLGDRKFVFKTKK